MTNGVPPITQAISSMLNALREAAEIDNLPVPPPPLPPASVSLVKVAERPVGLGNRLGSEIRNSFSVATLKGGRLEGVVRFQFWASELNAVDTAIDELHGRLLDAKDDLKTNGFLNITAEDTSLAQYVSVFDAWRKTTDYVVLYEFRYLDAGGAESLIAQIPIEIDSQYRDSTTVMDRMVRWDNQTTPPLIVRGRLGISSLSALSFISGAAPSGTVSLTRTFEGAVGLPTIYPTLAEFLDAVAGSEPSQHHGQINFTSLSDFLAAFSSVGDPIDLGDWDEDGVLDSHQSQRLSFEPAIRLPSSADRLEIAYQSSPFDQIAIVYLRVRSK